MTEKKTSVTLLQRISDQHDDKSWDDFISYYQPYVFIVLRNMGMNHHDCEDLCQEVMLRAWKALPTYQYQQDKCKFRTWLCALCRNSMHSFIRTRDSRQRREQIIVEDELTLGTQIIDAEIEDLAEREWRSYISKLAWESIKNAFSENAQSCFWLLSQGKPIREVAQELNLGEGSVRVNKNRITAALGKEIVRLDNQLEF